MVQPEKSKNGVWLETLHSKPQTRLQVSTRFLAVFIQYKNLPAPSSHVDVLRSLLPQLLSILFITRKFILCVVFHSHDDLKSPSQILSYFFTCCPDFHNVVAKMRNDFVLQFKCFNSQRREIILELQKTSAFLDWNNTRQSIDWKT